MKCERFDYIWVVRSLIILIWLFSLLVCVFELRQIFATREKDLTVGENWNC